MTWRELRTFIRHLPADSAYVRAVRIRRGENPDWTTRDEIARVAANAVITANYQRAGKRTPDSVLVPELDKRRRRPAPARGPTAGRNGNGHQELTPAEFDALFGG